MATSRNQTVQQIVVEALQQYLEAASITDVSAEEIAQTQVALLGEQADIE